MKRDFTVTVYATLLKTILDDGYIVQTFEQYLNSRNNLPVERQTARILILRHDVDKRPEQALKIALLEHEQNVCSTYYFRIVPASFDTAIITKIVELGHEIGYHYEDLSLAGGNMEQAVGLFEQHLKQLRNICPVKTICMHGSPFSRWDNRLLWTKINYRDYDLIGEPYLDLDFNQVLYISDTGRNWNNVKSNIRDKIKSNFNFRFKSTYDLIKNIQRGILPGKIMINVHPQRWSDDAGSWFRELVLQNLKNAVKYFWPR